MYNLPGDMLLLTMLGSFPETVTMLWCQVLKWRGTSRLFMTLGQLFFGRGQGSKDFYVMTSFISKNTEKCLTLTDRWECDAAHNLQNQGHCDNFRCHTITIHSDSKNRVLSPLIFPIYYVV